MQNNCKSEHVNMLSVQAAPNFKKLSKKPYLYFAFALFSRCEKENLVYVVSF